MVRHFAIPWLSRINITNTSLVWQIAIRDYKFGKGKLKSFTPATYWAVGDYFRELWGKEAGWAHSVGLVLISTTSIY